MSMRIEEGTGWEAQASKDLVLEATEPWGAVRPDWKPLVSGAAATEFYKGLKTVYWVSSLE